MDSAVPADHWVEIKESKNINKYIDLCQRTKKVVDYEGIPIITGVLGTVHNGLKRGLEVLKIRERIKTIQTTALLRSVRILRRDLETWGDLLSLRLMWKTISVKNSQAVKL